MQYVLGFLFSSNGSHVALIEKKHPLWQAGKWNGIGGKVKEKGESLRDAMRREFHEEAGVLISDWEHCLTLRVPAGTHKEGSHGVYIFRAFDDRVARAGTREEETVRVFPLLPTYSLPDLVVPNVRWMIPLLLDNMHWPMTFLEDPA